jgi:hypothetical protein
MIYQFIVSGGRNKVFSWPSRFNQLIITYMHGRAAQGHEDLRHGNVMARPWVRGFGECRRPVARVRVRVDLWRLVAL